MEQEQQQQQWWTVFEIMNQVTPNKRGFHMDEWGREFLEMIGL